MELLKSILPLDNYEFYLCGPPPFMQALFEGLTTLGVGESRIHYESCGPARVLKARQGFFVWRIILHILAGSEGRYFSP